VLFDQGQLEKMTLRALEYDSDGIPSEVPDKSFTVQVNPASYTLNKTIAYENQQSQGSQETTANFRSSGPTTIQFDITFDATGVIKAEGALDGVPLVGAIASLFSEDEELTVNDQIATFEEIVYTLDGINHRPNPVRIIWGEFSFDGALSSVNYSYTLFQPDGTPLRAKATCSFQTSRSGEENALEANLSSPDLTHIREIKEGDTLPLLAQKIYGNPELYLEIARVNQLIDFRRLKAGTRVSLPPIDKGV
jgi:hypothetical protein